MKLKKPIETYFNLNSTSEKPNIISLSHTDDKEVDFIELVLHQDLIRIDLTGSTAVARMVWEENNVLASDNVACTINDCGNILIPFDSAVIPLHSGILKIEINVTQDGKVFTLQTPLRVRFNPSILDNAEVTPDSKGTIPELLEEVKEQLERVEGFVDADEVNEIIDSKGYATAIAAKQDKLSVGNANELADVSATGEIKRSGYRVTTNKNVISNKPSAAEFIPNAKAIAEYVEEHSGTSDYNDLENKPSINGKTIEGNLTTADFDLKDGKDGKSIIGAEIIMGDLYLWIEVENEAGEKLIERKHIGRVVGANGTNGKNGDGYSAAEINANGDLILTVLTGDGKTSNVNLGHVVGADGANGKDGKDGAKGDKGDTGAKGEQGIQGEKGAKGDKGDKGDTGAQGPQGDNYVLTAQDKSDIANIVLSELPTTQEVLYGNASD